MVLSVVYIHNYNLRFKIEKNEMGGSCSAYEGEERRMLGLDGET